MLPIIPEFERPLRNPWEKGVRALLLSFVSHTEINIDIKPDSQHNSINPTSKGVTAVAVLTSEDFDALLADPDTVRFGPAEAERRYMQAHVEDVDSDGDMDLVFHFKTQETGIAARAPPRLTSSKNDVRTCIHCNPNSLWVIMHFLCHRRPPLTPDKTDPTNSRHISRQISPTLISRD